MPSKLSVEMAKTVCLQNQKRQKAAKTPPGSPGSPRSKQQSRQLPQGASQAAGATTALTSKAFQGTAGSGVDEEGKRSVPAQQFASRQTAAAAPAPLRTPVQGEAAASGGQAGARPRPQQPAISFAEDGTLVREPQGSVASSPQQLAAGITNVQPLVPAKAEGPFPPPNSGAQAAAGPERQQTPGSGAAAGSGSRAAAPVRSLNQGQSVAAGQGKLANQGLAAAETEEPAASPDLGARTQAKGPLQQLAASIKGLPPLMPRPAQTLADPASGAGAAPMKEPVQAAQPYAQQSKQPGPAEGAASGVEAAGAAEVTRASQRQAALPARGGAPASGSIVQASPSVEGISAASSGATQAEGPEGPKDGLHAKQQGAPLAGSSGGVGPSSGSMQDRAAQPPAAGGGAGIKAGSSGPVPAAASAAPQEGPSAGSLGVAAAQTHGARAVEAVPSAPAAATAASSPAEPLRRSNTLRQAGSAPSDVSSASPGPASPRQGQAAASSASVEAGSMNGRASMSSSSHRNEAGSMNGRASMSSSSHRNEAGSMNGRASMSSSSHRNGIGNSSGSGSPSRPGTAGRQAGASSSSQGTADNARAGVGSASSLEAGRQAASAGSDSQGRAQRAAGSGAQGTNTLRSKLGSTPPATLFIEDPETDSSVLLDREGAAEAARGAAVGGMPADGVEGSAVAAAVAKGTGVGSEAAAGSAEGERASRKQSAADRPSSGAAAAAQVEQLAAAHLEGTGGVQRVSQPAQDPLDDAQAVSAVGFASELLPGRPGAGYPRLQQRNGAPAALR